MENQKNIESYKKDLERFYLSKKITDRDILNFFKLNSIDVFKYQKIRKNDPRFRILFSIYFSPFILYDQEYLSDNLKSILPLILNTRYEMEIEELNYSYENFIISKNEYENMKQNLDYYYYNSSNDGKKILSKKNTVQNKKTMI